MVAIVILVETLSLLAEDHHSGWTQRNLGSSFSIDLRVHYPWWVLADIHFIHSTIKISKYYFFSISLIFIFHLILWSFRETSPSQMFPSAMNKHLYNSVVYKKYQSKLLREEIRAKWKRINILEKGYKEDERRGTLSCLDFWYIFSLFLAANC